MVKNGTKKTFNTKIRIKSYPLDRFWSSRFLNYRIDMSDKIGSFLSGTTTSMVVKKWNQKNVWVFFWKNIDKIIFKWRHHLHGRKNGTKKTFEGFLNVLNVLNMYHRNGSSAFVFSSYGVFKTSYKFYRQGATTFPLADGRVLFTLWVKFWFPYDQFRLAAPAVKITPLWMQIIQ